MSAVRLDRVAIGAFIDREQRDQLGELARRTDRTISQIVRAALARELERADSRGGTTGRLGQELLQ